MSATSHPHFCGTLGPVGLTFFGVTYMIIAVVFTTYGVVNQVTDGHLPTAYILAIIAMPFTAASYPSLGSTRSRAPRIPTPSKPSAGSSSSSPAW